MTCARVVACLAVLALFGGAILTQEPATGKGDKKPTKPAAAPADKKPTTHKVTKQPFKIERTITIHRPVEEVFAYISDVQHSPEYISGQREAHKTSTGPMGVGSTFATSGKFVRRDTMCEITEFEPNRRLSWQTRDEVHVDLLELATVGCQVGDRALDRRHSVFPVHGFEHALAA